MHLLLPVGFLAVADNPAAEKIMTEIHLNRSGINTIEVPPQNAHVECGSTLKIRFKKGAPPSTSRQQPPMRGCLPIFSTRTCM